MRGGGADRDIMAHLHIHAETFPINCLVCRWPQLRANFCAKHLQVLIKSISEAFRLDCLSGKVAGVLTNQTSKLQGSS